MKSLNYGRFGLFALTMLLTGTLAAGWSGAYADDSLTSTNAPSGSDSQGYSFLGLTGNNATMGTLGRMSIVEQLQTIHRLGQSSSRDALGGLITALNSSYPLARRKAAHSLLEKAKTVEPDDKRWLVSSLQNALHSSDSLVQKNIVRLMAVANVPEATASLRQFFRQSDKQAQLSAVDALSMEQATHQKLQMLTAVSPYPEVRQAAQQSLSK